MSVVHNTKDKNKPLLLQLMKRTQSNVMLPIGNEIVNYAICRAKLRDLKQSDNRHKEVYSWVINEGDQKQEKSKVERPRSYGTLQFIIQTFVS